MLNFKFIKFAFVFFIIIYFIIGYSPALAKFITIYPNQDEEDSSPSNGMVAAAVEAIPAKTDGEIVDCFDYYRFPSIQTSFETLKEFYEPGQTVYFKGELINKNKYPIADGYLFVRMARFNENYTQEGHDIVDEFFANSGPQGNEKFYLEGGERKKTVFSWNAPENLPEGVYVASFSFVVGKKMNLAGLSFTNEIDAGSTKFEIRKSATGAKRVFLEKSSFFVNGEKYDHIGLSPRFGKSAKVEVSGKLKNETLKKENVKLVYDLYYWDGLDDKNKISSQSEEITVASNSSHSFKYVIPKMDETVYFLRIAAIAGNGQKSIVNLRFASEQERPRINFFSPMKFPVLTGETMTNFACFHNTADNSAQGKVTMNVFDESGDKIQTLGYEGEITGRIMAVKKDMVASKNYNYLKMAASVFGADGRETDSYEIIYDCKNMNPENKECAKIQEEKTVAGASVKPFDKKDVAVGIIALMAIMAVAVLLRKFFINKVKPPLVFLLFALAVSSAVFLAGGADNRVLAKTVPVFSNFNFPPGVDCDKNVQGKGIYVGPIWDGDPLWICVSDTNYITIKHGVSRDEESDTLSVGQKIKFSYDPDDPVYYATTGANDSPFGEWCDDLSNKNCLVYEQIGFIGKNDQATIKDDIYMTWLAVKPDVSMTSDDPAVIKCEDMTCTAIGGGSATLTAHIGKVTARPWIKLYAGKGWEGWRYDYKGDEKMYDVNFDSATLTWEIAVDSPPICTASFSPALIKAGEPTTFRLNALNDADGVVPITCTDRQYNYPEGSSNYYFSISPLEDQNCVATVDNGMGGADSVATCSATVTVERAEELKVECSASPNPVSLNMPATFTATASSGAPPYTYTWKNDNNEVLSSGNNSSITESYATTGTKRVNIEVGDSQKNFVNNSCSVEVTPTTISSYSLTVNINADNCGGTISNKERSDSTGGTKTYTGYSSGDTVTLTATPGAYSGETCKMTGGWSTSSGGNCAGGTLSKDNTKEDTCELTMGSADKSVSVSFNQSSPPPPPGNPPPADPGTANLTLKKNGSGNVQLYGWRSTPLFTYDWNDYGDTIDSNFQNNENQGLAKDWWFKMSATPDSGSYFSSWSGCTSTSEGKSWTDADGVIHYSTPSADEKACYITMNNDKTAIVTFNSSSGPGDPGNPGGCVGCGSSVKAYISARDTVVPDGNSTVVTWTSDNADSCKQEEGGSDTGWLSASDTASGNYTTASFTASGGSRTYKVTCAKGSQSADAEATVSVGDYMGSPSVNMWADPQSVGYKKTTFIQWLSSNVFPNSCLLYSVSDTMNGYLAYFNFPGSQYFGPGYYKSEIGSNNTTGQATGKLSGNTTYKIQCGGYGPSFTKVTAQTTVTVAKPVSNFTLTNPTGASLVATIVEGLSANSSSTDLSLSGEAIGNVSLSASIPAISGAKAQFSSDDGKTWSDTLSVDISVISQVKIKAIKIPGATSAGTYNTAITATDTGTGGKTKKLNVNLRVNRVSSEWKEF